MKLDELLKEITRLPWHVRISNGNAYVSAGDGADTDISRVFIPYPLSGESGDGGAMVRRRQANAAYLCHAANVLPEVVEALRECQNALLEIGRMAQARKSCIRMPNGLMLDNYVGQVLSSNSKTAAALAKAEEVEL